MVIFLVLQFFIMMHHTNSISYSCTTTMASRIPARSQGKTLEDYEGTLTEQLGSLLRAFGLSTNIPVKTYTYKDDRTAVKYRVVIILPDGLAPSPVQPSGVGRGQMAAYHEAVV
jgi:hypothetical protein